MISGAEIRDARERAGMTQQQLGTAVGVGQRTIGNWERGETVPRNREARVRLVLAEHLDAPLAVSPLRVVSDAELIAEVARRLSVMRQENTHGHPAPTTAAGSAPADRDVSLPRAHVLPEPPPESTPTPPAETPHRARP